MSVRLKVQRLKSAKRLLLSLFLALAIAGAVGAQSLIVIEKSVHVRHLSGFVVDPNGGVIAGAKVEIRAATDDRILATTTTDSDGGFDFDPEATPARCELRASAAGFQIVQYSVLRRWIGRGGIRIVLPVAV